MSKTVLEIMAKYDNSIIFSRWFATMIDNLLLIGMSVVVIILMSPRYEEYSVLTCLGLILAYYIFHESYFGYTIGKLVTGLRIVNINGEKPGVGRVTVRTLTRIIELNPIVFGGIPAGVTVLVSNNKQRIGDLLVTTYVVQKKDLDLILQ